MQNYISTILLFFILLMMIISFGLVLRFYRINTNNITYRNFFIIIINLIINLNIYNIINYFFLYTNEFFLNPINYIITYIFFFIFNLFCIYKIFFKKFNANFWAIKVQNYKLAHKYIYLFLIFIILFFYLY